MESQSRRLLDAGKTKVSVTRITLSNRSLFWLYNIYGTDPTALHMPYSCRVGEPFCLMYAVTSNASLVNWYNQPRYLVQLIEKGKYDNFLGAAL